MTNLVAQTYKAPRHWRGHPPGIGDFVRGACHLLERLDGTGIELRLDVSQTGFAHVIEQDPSVFFAGDPQSIADAAEYFEDDEPFEADLAALKRAERGVLHVCSNMGAWNRVTLPLRTRQFMAPFYRFVPEIERAVTELSSGHGYRVVNIRCGDRYFSDPAAAIPDETVRLVSTILERDVLVGPSPVVVMSDSAVLKSLLSRRYGLPAMSHQSQHGAFGGAEAVARDLCLLKRSSFNIHINTWADWWSGFSHYTSMIFNVPSANYRAPRFAREEVWPPADGLRVDGD